MSGAIRSQGTQVYFSIGSPTTYTKVGKITGFDGPGGTAGTIDDTDLDDTAYKSFMTGLIDAGEVSFDLNLDPANVTHAALQAAQESHVEIEVKITPPVGSLSLYFNAFVKTFRVSATPDNKYKASCAFLCHGGYGWRA